MLQIFLSHTYSKTLPSKKMFDERNFFSFCCSQKIEVKGRKISGEQTIFFFFFFFTDSSTSAFGVFSGRFRREKSISHRKIRKPLTVLQVSVYPSNSSNATGLYWSVTLKNSQSGFTYHCHLRRTIIHKTTLKNYNHLSKSFQHSSCKHDQSGSEDFLYFFELFPMLTSFSFLMKLFL